jgi:uncharacterized membrane protein YbhN (UPF0104 family)
VKRWFNYLIYASLGFLVVALYRADYLVIPHVYSVPALAGSIAVICAALVAEVFSWQRLVQVSGYPVSRTESLAAVGLSTFAKYIPGKIWTIVGRAAYLADIRSTSISAVSSLTLTWQFLMLWLGLFLGGVGLFMVQGLKIWGWPVLLTWIGLTVLTFTNVAQDSTRHLIRRFLKRDITVPQLRIGQTLACLPWSLSTLFLMAVGFDLLARALIEGEVPLSVGLAFPLTMSIGVMAVFFPGGVGVREGAMVGYLKLAGIPVPDAIALSIASRLWFLLGETFIFGLGIIADRRVKSVRRTGEGAPTAERNR